MRRRIRALLSLPIILLFVTTASAETVRVFAASSLTEAFQEIAVVFREQHPGDEIEFNFAGSQVLRVQIEHGATADVFASADRIHMDALREKGLVAPDVVFAKNRLVVVTPRIEPIVRRLVDVAQPGVRVVIADANVPVGRYTTQALGKMNRSSLYGDDYQSRVMANVVSQETNVRAVLAKVSLDEVDAGFVYATDATAASKKTAVIDIPDHVNVIAEYPIAVLAGTGIEGRAAQFVALTLGAQGQAILAKRGFQSPGK
jgi:molybdate transport system substrate-binding protein